MEPFRATASTDPLGSMELNKNPTGTLQNSNTRPIKSFSLNRICCVRKGSSRKKAKKGKERKEKSNWIFEYAKNEQWRTKNDVRHQKRERERELMKKRNTPSAAKQEGTKKNWMGIPSMSAGVGTASRRLIPLLRYAGHRSNNRMTAIRWRRDESMPCHSPLILEHSFCFFELFFFLAPSRKFPCVFPQKLRTSQGT